MDNLVVDADVPEATEEVVGANVVTVVCNQDGTENSSLKTDGAHNHVSLSLEDSAQSTSVKSQALLGLHDFAALDDLPWIRILCSLDQKDRLNVSKTCSRLESICLSTSSLWRSFNLHLGLEFSCFPGKVMRLKEVEKKVIKFSRYMIQDVSISIHGIHAKEFDKESMDLMIEAAKNWSLRSFRFFTLCHPDEWMPCTASNFCFLYQFMFNCLCSEKLERLEIITLLWGLTDTPSPYVVLKSMADATFHQSLQFLALDCICYHQLTEQIVNTTYQLAIAQLLGRLQNLQELHIHSAYLTDKLLSGLCQPDHVSLQSMTIVADNFDSRGVTLWPQFLKHSPLLKVNVHASEVFDCERAYFALPACVPIVEWYIFEPLADSWEDFYDSIINPFELLPLYAQTLEELSLTVLHADFIDSPDYDLISLIIQCSRLQTLVYPGEISSDLILKIAALPRKWLKLYFLGRNIIFPDDWEGTHTEKIARLSSEVSVHLGIEWEVCSSSKQFEFDNADSCRFVKESVGYSLQVNP